MLKLTTKTGMTEGVVYVSPEHVTYVSPYHSGDGAHVWIRAASLRVVESADDIAKALAAMKYARSEATSWRAPSTGSVTASRNIPSGEKRSTTVAPESRRYVSTHRRPHSSSWNDLKCG